MNSRAKGAQIEREAETRLQQDGWATIRVAGASKFQQRVDFFAKENSGYGFDIIAKKGKQTRYIQVKYRAGRTTSVSPRYYMPFVREYLCEHDTAEIWTRKKSYTKFYQVIIKPATGGPVVEKGEW